MANKLFQETQNNNLMNKLDELKKNPARFFAENGLKVPKEYQNNPHDIVNYLVQSGQVSQDRINSVMQIANKIGIKLW